ncbi:hypothetical protein Pcinc_036839 [Petrolisthes cinctipes]|uniref:Cationic amino acid transporter C-terminal domain-containing protein n=1 Tax=Petrolisthes cinctipes TaxID=88211 RepID=A0AAE1BXU1_PETCI|nr:hypothetical protein Pcinc_036839 [Petrolisthes cinctipes]
MAPPLLLPTRRHHSLSSSARHAYSALVRTRPFPSKTRRQNAHTPAPPPPGIWGWNTCGRGLVKLVYRSTGVWAVLGVSYVVGLVAGPIAGSAVSSSLLVAAVTSILTGFCYAEMVTWNSQSSGHLYTASYQSVGEFVAYLLGAINTLFAAATLAAVSKALSATMDYMCGEKVARFVSSNLGRFPLSDAPPDFIAAGACLSVAVVLAVGLEQAGVLRATMSVTSVVTLVFFLAVGGSSVSQGAQRLHHALHTAPSEMLAGAGVCMVLYSGLYECGRLSKAYSRPHRVMPQAISLAIALAFLAFFSLGIVITLVTSNDLPADGAPLLQAMDRADLSWAKLVLGCCQVVMLCVALVEAADPLSRQLVTLSSDGLLPPSLARPSARTTAPSNAHLTGGCLAALLALITNHVFLLQVIATSVLCLHSSVVMLCLYRCRRCPYAPLCRVAATPSSRTPYCPSRHHTPATYQCSAPPRSRGERTLHFLKDGLRVIPHRVRPGSEPRQDNDDNTNTDSITHTPQDTTTRDTATLLDHLHDPHASPPSTPPPLAHPLGSPSHNTLGTDVNRGDGDESDNEGSESEDSIAPLTDNDVEDDDIDAAVAQYKEQIQVATVDSGGVSVIPTPATARRACLAMVVLLLAVVVASVTGILGWQDGNTHPALIGVVVVSLVVGVMAVVVLRCVPTLKPTQAAAAAAFTVPASPWLPAAALLLNVILLVQSLRHSWLLMTLYMLAAVCWYFSYSLHHSALATSHSRPTPLRRSHTSETINLEPLAPPHLIATLLQTTAQQPDSYRSHKSIFTRLTPVDTVHITR